MSAEQIFAHAMAHAASNLPSSTITFIPDPRNPPPSELEAASRTDRVTSEAQLAGPRNTLQPRFVENGNPAFPEFKFTDGNGMIPQSVSQEILPLFLTPGELMRGGRPVSRIEEEFNGLGDKTKVTLFGDDGSKTAVQIDHDSTKDWSQQTTSIDTLNRTERTETHDDSGAIAARYFDPSDTQLWTDRWVDIDSSGHTIADIRDYTAVANDWVAHHTLPTANLWQVDSEFITDFSAQVERAALHGLSVEQPTPAPIDYERTGFGFDLGAYAFDPSGTTFSLGGSGGSGSGFDFSGYVYGGGGALTLGLKVSVETNLMDLAFGGLGWLFPVVLDLDGNGVRIEPRMDLRVFFNADGDAALERTAWVGAGDGLLAHDLDGNGQITRADEIAFADRTPDPNDSDLTALATLYDANADGVLDAGDAIWNQLRVWKDTNRNGKSDIGELNSLAAWGISAISLVSDHRSFSLPDGSRIEGFGSFVMNGATRSLADTALAFQTNGFTRSTNGEFVHYTSQDNATVRTYVDARLTTSYNTPPGAVIEIDVNPDPDGWLAGRFSDRILIRNATKPLTLYGDEGDDWLWSGAGNDVLDGGPGLDKMLAGAGDDTVYFDAVETTSQDAIVDGGTGYDTGFLMPGGPVTISLSSHNLEALISNEWNDTIFASPFAAAYIDGRGGNDTIHGSAFGDVLVGGTGSDQIFAGGGADLIYGGEGNDGFDAGSGNDVLDGGAGADVMDGGPGDDTIIIDHAGDWIHAHAGHGNDTARASVSYRLAGVEIENLTLAAGAGAISGWGNALDNWIEGNESANLLYGEGGADTLVGGAGDDYYLIENSADRVIERPGEGRDTVHAWASFTLGAEIEVLALGPGAGAISGRGNALDNWIEGNESANNLYGEGGADTLVGGAGDDIYHIDNPGDSIIEHAHHGNDTARVSISYRLAEVDIENLVLVEGAGAVDGVGNAMNNTLTGNESNNTLDGGGGLDTLAGGGGDDTYHIDNPGDSIIEHAHHGNDTARVSISYRLAEVDIENLVLVTGAGAITGVGNAMNNTLTGNESANGLDGLAGADVMAGGAGDDTYHVDNPGDMVIEHGGAGYDTVRSTFSYGLAAEVEALVLLGSAVDGVGNGLANTITGNAGDNGLDGLGGADILIGGAGVDRYYVDNPGDQVVELPDEGIDWVRTTVSYTLGANAEILLLLEGAGAINGSGNALDNWIGGNESANNLYGGGGGDTMEGGAGDDYYHVENSGDWVIERPGEGRDLVHAWVNFTLGADIELLALGAGAGAINGVGNALDNWIGGNESANLLYGGGGGDTMEGGAGDDYYHVENSGDWAIERPGEGRDLVHSWVNFTLGAEIENLALGAGAGAINGVGNALDNWIGGNESANLLYGGGGGDTMEGGAGDDYYHVENSGDWAIERPGEGRDLVHAWVNFTLGADIEYLALGAGAGAINGVGNALDNWIGGNESANLLYGGGGGDTMEGGAGDDYYHVENSGDWAIERPGEGRDLVHSWVSFTLGAEIEYLALGAGAGAIHGIGNALDNWIGGNESANYLYGGGGADGMEGGAGDDYYQVENSGDWVFERPGEGRDTVHAWVGFTLGPEIEVLALGAGAGAIHGIGNALDNWIGGNESANNLYGGGGGDTMEGGAGDDRLAGGDGTDAAVFSGARLDYAVTFDAATQTYTVADRRAGAPDGSDSVTGVELFLFADGAVHQWELVG